MHSTIYVDPIIKYVLQVNPTPGVKVIWPFRFMTFPTLIEKSPEQ